MHEFGDSCVAQYKSRHCVSDLSCSLANFGYTIVCNFLETSHAKGEQDAAGSRVKQKVSQAVPRRTAMINSAESIHQYLVLNFSQPAASSFMARTTSVQLKRHVFFYIPAVGEGAANRKRDRREFKEAKRIGKWYCVKSLGKQEKLMVRN